MNFGSTPIPHIQYGQTWGSEARNLAIGYFQYTKPYWQQEGYTYQDVGALERFGIDPMKPAGGGVIMQANAYGYPVDGYTTGYTMKLPPPANMQLAQQIPRSFNTLQVIDSGDGIDDALPTAGDNPVDAVNWWQGRSKEEQTEMDLRRQLAELHKRRTRKTPAKPEDVAQAADIQNYLDDNSHY